MNALQKLNEFVDLQRLQMLLLLGGLVAFVILETVNPAVQVPLRDRARGGVRNLTLFVVGTALTSVVIGTFYYFCAAFLAANRVGLLYLLPLPLWLSVLLGFLALDFTDYLYHRVSHERKWLWVMHAVHHSEPRLDVTTHFRAHPLHMLVSVGWRIVVIAAFGIPFWLLVVRDTGAMLLALWQHANLRGGGRVDRWLRLLLVTPGMHRIHHSPVPEDTDSNFGGFLSVWDRLLGTYREQRSASPMPYGLRQLAPARYQTLAGMLLTPLRAWPLAGRL